MVFGWCWFAGPPITGSGVSIKQDYSDYSLATLVPKTTVARSKPWDLPWDLPQMPGIFYANLGSAAAWSPVLAEALQDLHEGLPIRPGAQQHRIVGRGPLRGTPERRRAA